MVIKVLGLSIFREKDQTGAKSIVHALEFSCLLQLTVTTMGKRPMVGCVAVPTPYCMMTEVSVFSSARNILYV